MLVVTAVYGSYIANTQMHKSERVVSYIPDNLSSHNIMDIRLELCDLILTGGIVVLLCLPKQDSRT